MINDATQMVEYVPLQEPLAALYRKGSLNSNSSSLVVHEIAGLIYLAAGDVYVIQDTESLVRPPVYVGAQHPVSIFVYDSLTKTLVDEWGAAYPDEGLAIRPGGGALYLVSPQTDEGEDLYQVFRGAGDIWTPEISSETGGVEPRVPVVSPNGERVYVTNSGSNDLSVIRESTGEVLAMIPVGHTPWGLAITPDGEKLYVANSGESTVSVISTASNSVVSTIPVGWAPWGVAVNPSGTKVYVANSSSNSVSVISATTDQVIKAVAVGPAPHWLAVTPDGTSVYVGNSGGTTVSVIATSNDTLAATVGVGDRPEGIAALPDGSEMWVVNRGLGSYLTWDEYLPSSISVIDTDTRSVTSFDLPLDDFGGASWGAVPIAIPDPTAKVAGRVSSGCVPVGGAVVRVLQATVEKGQAQSNAAGDFSVFNLQPGSYDIEISATGYLPQSFTAEEARPGQTVVMAPDLVPSTGTHPDSDNDGVPDGCDLCAGDNATGDADGDGICADLDCDDADPTNVCLIFEDGFESGDTNGWAVTIP